MDKPRIGYVGLGVMGGALARRLLREHALTVFDLSPERRAEFAALGATVVDSPAAVGAASDIVLTCLPTSAQVKEVIFGDNHGLIRGLRAGGLIADQTSGATAATRAMAAELAGSGIDLIDAPVSGGPARAKTGTLTLMVGASDADLTTARPVLEAMGTPNHVGPVGMGETVKLVNQIMISSIMLANCEGLVFAAKAGANVEAVREVILTATGSNYLLQNWLPQTWLSGNFDGGFALDLLRKDVAAALDAARTMGVPMPSTALAYQLFTAASSEGHGRHDYSSVSTFYERAAGTHIAKPA